MTESASDGGSTWRHTATSAVSLGGCTFRKSESTVGSGCIFGQMETVALHFKGQ